MDLPEARARSPRTPSPDVVCGEFQSAPKDGLDERQLPPLPHPLPALFLLTKSTSKNLPTPHDTHFPCEPPLGIARHDDDVLHKTCRAYNNKQLQTTKTLLFQYHAVENKRQKKKKRNKEESKSKPITKTLQNICAIPLRASSVESRLSQTTDLVHAKPISQP